MFTVEAVKFGTNGSGFGCDESDMRLEGEILVEENPEEAALGLKRYGCAVAQYRMALFLVFGVAGFGSKHQLK